ncbi:MAG: hypothetical protein K2V38_06740 [Gemmataceae bacterium]|nr:hypothetical protein [Gemmataceae bacterium]
MTTLEDAWRWYQAVAECTKRLTHLAKFWGEFPWGQGDEWVRRVERDGVLRHVETVQLVEDVEVILDEHDDLAVLVLFSVFEATVRARLKTQLAPELGNLRHPSLVEAGKAVEEAIEHGSFGRLFQAFKLEEKDKNLVAQVNQIRQWRNWVAHGRRPEMRPAAEVQPSDAYKRLGEFLNLLSTFDSVDTTTLPPPPATP